MNTLPPENLSDDERVLLHLAGELPAGAAVDPAAAPELRAAWARLDGALQFDAAATPVGSPASAARAVLAAMRQQALAPAETARRRRRLWRPPGWVLYPAAAAAAIALMMVGWWYKVHDDLAVKVEPAPPMLALLGRPDVDLSELDDDRDILFQTNSMIVDRSVGQSLETQFAALEYLESVTR